MPFNIETVKVLDYVYDQPRALREAYNNREVFLSPLREFFKNNEIKKVFFFGSGTSYNVSILAAHYFKQLAKTETVGYYPTVFTNYEEADLTGTLLPEEILFIGISQSGTSYSTIDVMKHAKSKGYQTIALTENLNSEITKHVDTVIHLLCGKELLPPETRGYTVSALTVYLFALEVGYTKGVLNTETYNKHLEETQELFENFETVIEESRNWYETHKTQIINSDRIIVAGYGVDYASTLEAQLKIGEMLRYPCFGYEIEEYIHGHAMAITPRHTILLIGSDEKEWDRMLLIRERLLKYTQRVHVITYKELDNVHPRDLKFSVKTNKYLGPIMFTIPIQMIAVKGAEDTGIDTRIHPFNEKLGHM